MKLIFILNRTVNLDAIVAHQVQSDEMKHAGF